MRGRRGGAWIALAHGLVTIVLVVPARALELRGASGRIVVGGWAEVYAVAPTNPDGRYQGPSGTLALTLSGDVRRKVKFFLDVRSTFGGPIRHPDGAGVVNLRDTWQNDAPAVEFEQGYADATLGPIDLRIGKQKFAWGKLDTFAPTDVLNPRRYTDPFVETVEESKIGIPAARAAYFLPPLGHGFEDASATLIWIPFPVPARFPLENERWFPSSTTVPAFLPVPGSTFGANLPNLLARNTLATRSRPPALQLDEGGVAFRLAGLWRRADWALYYYDGPETFPSFDVGTTVRAAGPFAACLSGQVSGPCTVDTVSTLRTTTDRIRLVGADAAVEWNGFTARAEGAWSSDRMLPRTIDDLVTATNLARVVRPRLDGILMRLNTGRSVRLVLGDLFVPRDVVEWGVGVDRSWHGWTPVLQINQTVVLHNDTTLLIDDVDTRFLGVVRKTFLGDRMPTELGVLQSVARGYTSAILRVTYNFTDHIRARVGYVFIAGSRHSLIGQFHDDDEAFFQLRYSY